MSSSPSSVAVTIDNTLGAVLVGFAVACCVYGILVTQVFTYYSNYPSDRAVYKFLVLLILVLETTDQALIGHIIYHYGITNFANLLALLRGDTTWSLILQQTIGATVGAIVKMSFALRVWRFSERNWIITAFIVILIVGQLGTAFAFTAKAFQLPGVFAVVHIQTLGTVSLALGVFTDIVIAISLCYFLNKLRTGYHQSDTLVNSLVRYAISTGALTGAISLTTLILYNIMPTNLVFIATYFVLSKLTSTVLNTRRVVRGKGTDKQGTTSNHTNLFHLGTRMPSMGPNDMDGWEAAYTPSVAQLTSAQLESGHLTSGQLTSGSAYSQAESFPMNSFHPGHSPAKVYGQAF
ncbi:hypothetical protein Moror_10970 [Moniliophthora roreri MCA 2997]|uniref:DUF6534 domain-containing protein n=1 Tax=Moniliophthora roreri (strain MCA 2997) TaxID=1381753 RepID=V2X088_MONRO|nr:hypothetical protein Moror_10970 [Moniliophthora roreri MCA 2997]